MSTRILVVGSGGREHALAENLARGDGSGSMETRTVMVSPGNAGIARDFDCFAAPSKGPAGVVDVAKSVQADLVVVGPEQPLVDGVVDALSQEGIPTLGPTTPCARLEGSKAFMKDFVAQAGVPTARYGIFTRSDEIAAFLDTLPHGAVVKSDGLAAGKGVTVCPNTADALEVAKDFLGELGTSPRFGDASTRVVIEEFLPGLELSIIALCDGKNAYPFACARDHKRLMDDDKGPNTGGMGAIFPLGAQQGVSPELMQKVQDEIFGPTLHAFRKMGTPYRGFLYAGLMVHEHQSKLLEFNVRFGDPEAQAILWGTRQDLLPAFMEVAKGGSLGTENLNLQNACVPCATVVCASPGYPEKPTLGAPIEGLDEAMQVPEAKIFFAGVRQGEESLLTAGGRVLACTARGENHAQALERAYQAADLISFAGKQMRRDIGKSILSLP